MSLPGSRFSSSTLYVQTLYYKKLTKISMFLIYTKKAVRYNSYFLVLISVYVPIGKLMMMLPGGTVSEQRGYLYDLKAYYDPILKI